jgi:fructose-1,6-bisphosphatase/inositol monophosphatase family enzyme
MTYDEVKILAEIILNVRNLRSSNSVFDLMQVAKGRYGAALNRTSKVWDNVAPQINT